jgi:hypothetical protein
MAASGIEVELVKRALDRTSAHCQPEAGRLREIFKTSSICRRAAVELPVRQGPRRDLPIRRPGLPAEQLPGELPLRFCKIEAANFRARKLDLVPQAHLAEIKSPHCLPAASAGMASGPVGTAVRQAIGAAAMAVASANAATAAAISHNVAKAAATGAAKPASEGSAARACAATMPKTCQAEFKIAGSGRIGARKIVAIFAIIGMITGATTTTGLTTTGGADGALATRIILASIPGPGRHGPR